MKLCIVIFGLSFAFRFPFSAYTLNLVDWSSCGTDQDLLQVSNIRLHPDSPKRGENVDILVSGHLNTAISTGGKLNIEAKFGKIPVYKGTLDFCDFLDRLELMERCPLQAGPVQLQKMVVLPSMMLSGEYNVMIRGEDENSRQIGCVNMKLTITK